MWIASSILSLLLLLLGNALSTAESSTTVCVDQEPNHQEPDPSTIPRVDASSLTTDGVDTDMIAAEATRLLQIYGAVVIENLVPDSVMDQLASQLDTVAKNDNGRGIIYGTQGSFAGAQTTRNAAKCLGESRVAQELAVHNVTVQVVKNVLLPFCKRVVLGTSSVISVVGPSSPEESPAPAQEIHRDDSMWNGDWWTNMACTHHRLDDNDDKDDGTRFPHLSVSVMWAMSDFTAANGATQVALYSHRQCPRTVEPPPDMSYEQAVMTKGSVLLWLGGTFHGAAAAQPYVPTRQARQGLLFIYNWGMLRSEHNFFNAIPHEVLQTFDDKLLDLLGYAGKNPIEHPWYIGPVYAQPYLGGPRLATSAGENGEYSVEPDSLFE